VVSRTLFLWIARRFLRLRVGSFPIRMCPRFPVRVPKEPLNRTLQYPGRGFNACFPPCLPMIPGISGSGSLGCRQMPLAAWALRRFKGV